ncbi:hypothetical protein AYI68_g5903, partial [Smittium mucronatum]
MKSRPATQKKKREAEKKSRKHVEWAENEDTPSHNPRPVSSTLTKIVSKPDHSYEPSNPNPDDSHILDSSSKFMVGSSRESSVNDSREQNSDFSSWQTTPSNTASSSADNFRNLESRKASKTTQNSGNAQPNVEISPELNHVGNEQPPESEISKTPQNSNFVSDNASDNANSKKMFLVSSESSISDSISGDVVDTQTTLSNDAPDSPQINFVPQSDHSYLKPSTRVSADLSQLSKNNTFKSALSDSSQSFNSDNNVTVLLSPTTTPQKNELVNSRNHTINETPNSLSKNSLNSPSNSPRTNDVYFDLHSLDSNVYLNSSTQRTAMLQRQLAHQQDLEYNAEIQRESTYKYISSLTSSKSNYVSAKVASFLTDSEPIRNEVLESSDHAYDWAKITNRPFEYNFLRSAYISRSHQDYSNHNLQFGSDNQKKIPSNLDGLNSLHSSKNSNLHKNGDKSFADSVNTVDDEWFLNLYPPSLDESSGKDHHRHQNDHYRGNNVDLLQWFKPLSKTETEVYYTPKRIDLSSISTLEKEFGIYRAGNNNYNPDSNSYISSNSSKGLLKYSKQLIKNPTIGILKPSEWEAVTNDIIEKNPNKKKKIKKSLPAIKLDVNMNFQPSHLRTLIDSKAELTLANRTSMKAIKQKISPPQRLVTNSIATLETWKGRRVPGLLKLNIYTGSSFITDNIRFSNKNINSSAETVPKDANTPSNDFIIDHTSFNLRQARAKASKGIPIYILYEMITDYSSAEKHLTEYYCNYENSSESVSASKPSSIGSSFFSGQLGVGYGSSKKSKSTDLTMPSTKMVSAQDFYYDLHEIYFKIKGTKNKKTLTDVDSKASPSAKNNALKSLNNLSVGLKLAPDFGAPKKNLYSKVLSGNGVYVNGQQSAENIFKGTDGFGNASTEMLPKSAFPDICQESGEQKQDLEFTVKMDSRNNMSGPIPRSNSTSSGNFVFRKSSMNPLPSNSKRGAGKVGIFMDSMMQQSPEGSENSKSDILSLSVSGSFNKNYTPFSKPTSTTTPVYDPRVPDGTAILNEKIAERVIGLPDLWPNRNNFILFFFLFFLKKKKNKTEKRKKKGEPKPAVVDVEVGGGDEGEVRIDAGNESVDVEARVDGVVDDREVRKVGPEPDAVVGANR